jgi:hypothetical protein
MTGFRPRRQTPLLILAAILSVVLIGARTAEAQNGTSSKEVLNYAIEWRLIPAGIAKLTVSSFAPPSNTARAASPLSEVRLHIESAGLVSRLFRVDDDYTSLSGQNFCGQSTFMSAHEGSRSKETRVVFDPQVRRATWVEKDLVKNATNTQGADIPPCVHDVMSGLMVLRNLRLEPGKTASLPLSDGKKFVQAKVESQRREEIKTDLGTFKTIRYEVFLFDNVLYKRSGHLHVWLTDDDRRIPVQIQVRLQFTIGTITFRLIKEEK